MNKPKFRRAVGPYPSVPSDPLNKIPPGSFVEAQYEDPCIEATAALMLAIFGAGLVLGVIVGVVTGIAFRLIV